MVIDTSAIIAIMRDEPEAPIFARVIATSPDPPAMSLPTLLETSIVLERAAGAEAVAQLDRFMKEANIEGIPFTFEHLAAARAAFRRFGKGSGHPAGLNFGDCFSYALASTRAAPLLYKGVDFAATDIVPAVL
jgi:ribonuclease VapC